jgi:hypothetical protein
MNIKILICLLLLSSFGYSQKPTVCIPSTTAKKIVEDLVIGDSARDLLVVVTQELDLTREKVRYQDSVIAQADSLRLSFEKLVNNEKAQKNNYIDMYNNCENQYGSLSRKYKMLKVKSRLFSFLGAGTIVGLGVLLYILK